MAPSTETTTGTGTGGGPIRLAVVGVGNCASSLIQGIYYYRQRKDAERADGLTRWDLGGYTPADVEVAAAFDVDDRKVGKDVAEAIFAPPNCTAVFWKDVPKTGVTVAMGPILDGVSEHMKNYADDETFLPAAASPMSKEEIVGVLREKGCHVLMNYLPVGSQRATEFWAEVALEAKVAFVNCIPVFIASDPAWAARFRAAGVPIVGDDIKAQLGATVLHRTLTQLFKIRGVQLDRTYQLNVGGNTDFLNMKNQARLASKKVSKTEAVQSAAADRLPDRHIHVGPSDYVPWLHDQKIGFIRMEGRLFGDVPMNLELRLSVEDSPNSAGVAVDALRCAKVALDRGIGGVLEAPAAFLCKHPPKQIPEEEALALIDDFLRKV